jgi:hypothetical protein
MRPNNDGKRMDDEIDRGFLTRLRKLIGRKCTYLGKDCLLIDLLSEEGVLILEAQERLPPIQTDQYGQATCRSNELLQVPIFGNDETSFSEEIMDLLASLSNGEKNRKPAPP